MISVHSAVSSGSRRSIAVFAFVVAIAALAPVLGVADYGLDVMSEIMIFSIAAISLDLLIGYGGLVSFGHAAFFGTGAYATILLAVTCEWNTWLSMVAATVISGVVAALVGAFCVRMSGVSFFMMTLAFSQLFYSAAVKWRWLTGGSDGIGGLTRPDVFGFSANSQVTYLFLLACLALVFAAMRVVIRSQFGRALIGTRENETRMIALGYATTPIKFVTFTISGTVAGLSGATYALFNGFTSPDALSWGISGMLLLMVVLGGRSTLVGPIFGAAAYLLMKNFVSSHTDHWLLIVGGTFIACVMFFPEGIYGLRKLWARRL